MILACDIGLKRIGLAIYVQKIVLPLDPIKRISRKQASLELLHLLETKKATKLIVGLPHTCYTTRQRVLHFINLLNFAPVIYVEEDNSSVEALTNLWHLSSKKCQKASKDGTLDSLAACEILRRYLAQEMLV
ncbi:Holliday junction resolvase RuvX [Helicobacter suis]|uniref:Holliday junction resolvase RuvX n=1 Tax=Helicobacter suis TaxID=104628 RepID=UPI0013D2BB1C|nr:Holliday junction resolvase RuvX [Helicobacter suis]